jgi:hypothetical protein
VGTDDEPHLTPADRERLQLAGMERWFEKRAVDRGHDLYFAKQRAIKEAQWLFVLKGSRLREGY